MEDPLFPTSPELYGEQYQEHLVAQYKMMVESAERNSDRRLDAHKYFATINAAMLTALGLTLQFGNYESRMWARLVIALGGVGASLVYWMLIKSYKSLNSAKFKVIHRIEKKTPLALFSAEWEELGNGDDEKKHRPFVRAEIWIPIAFGIGYTALFIWCIRWFI